ncbi:VOC family protein [Stappia sp. F7233]|uniref:VOC family protein n=1 Tax=Stappia albiluteola TaxID=2758565 RepID=A0A839ACE1_9HYPH|nr:VOC family protein [Stappia albiluteola]MBA5776547.1 VOC family protein [Stappia albiluteola]
MARGIDHIVWAVRDIAATGDFLERAGFTLTPLARHPWGTVNRLVQFDGAFLEVLSIGDIGGIVEPKPGVFSFGAFNRDFLAKREGASMLVLESRDPQLDGEAFEKARLATYEPFSFERIATGPDGSERKVAFDLTFTRDAAAPSIGYFTCFHRFPENFWKPEFQQHENGAIGIDAAVFVMNEPADHHIFFSAFSGIREMRATTFGLSIRTPRGAIEILTPAGYRSLYGHDAAVGADEVPLLAAARLRVKDLGKTTDFLTRAGISFHEALEGIVVPAKDCFGFSLAFSQGRD